MKNLISRWLHRLAPPLPIHDALDHPAIRRMSPHELDDLPFPRGAEKNTVREICQMRK